ncbi:c-type cytochrome [Candidatus Deferrimicrobium sp.]|uniref:c-type cytochrome n=1 Tax=Candidatus Deferrimicrobium sp. TaxID=3060586 RepID=UPI003C63A395
MRVRSVVLSVVSVMLIAFALGCAKQEPPKPAAPAAPAADGKALFDAKCAVCHGLDRASIRHETREKWERIVEEMQGKKSGWISDAEASKIVDYLAAEHGK